MTMPRYIDADKLKERLMVGSELDPEPCKGFRSALLAMVDSQEDADVVEVVRCKDCAYKQYYFTNDMVKCGCGNGAHHENFFCADGERRTDDE